MNRPYSFCIVLIAMMFAGCTLDDIVDRGATCPPNGKEGIVLKWDDDCYAGDSCKNGAAEEIREGACPASYDVCQKNDSDEYETDYWCKQSGIHCCGPKCTNCMKESVKGATCQNDMCVISECSSNYQLVDGKCIESCQEGEARCVNDNSREVCDDGVYVLEFCSADDKCKSGQCLKN
ncbi:MAG: hypothetical protein IJM59_04690 [Proteobacteria bacterium]|nr:hypothetical protein [Pseudomonadota bacterium]